MSRQFFFSQLECPVSSAQAAHRFYKEPSADAIESFNQVNGLDGKSMLYPGHFMVIPSLEKANEDQMGAARYLNQRINHGQRNSGYGPAPAHFNNGFNTWLYGLMTDRESYLNAGNLFSEITTAHVEKTLHDINADLVKLNQSYLSTETARRGTDFPKKAFRRSYKAGERARIYRNLDDKLARLPRRLTALGARPQSAKDALNIYSNDVSRAFEASGSDADIKKISKVIERHNSISKKAVSGQKYIAAPLLTGVGGILEIQDVRGKIKAAEKERPDLAPIVGVYESSKAAGGVAGGYAGGLLAGGIAQGIAAVALGSNPVGWGVAATIAVVTIAGSAYGAYLGSEKAGDMAEDYLKETAPLMADDIDVVVSRKDGEPLPPLED